MQSKDFNPDQILDDLLFNKKCGFAGNSVEMEAIEEAAHKRNIKIQFEKQLFMGFQVKRLIVID